MKILGIPKESKKKENKRKSQNKPEEYPLIPLKNLVIFPQMARPFVVGRKKSLLALEKAMNTNRKIFLAMQKNAKIDKPSPTDIYPDGTLCEILQIVKIPDGTVKVLVEGLERGQIVEIDDSEGYYKVKVDFPKIEPQDSAEIEALIRNLVKLFEEYMKLNPRVPPDAIVAVSNAETSEEVCNLILTHLNLKPKVAQELLGIYDPAERIRRLIKVLTDEIEMAKIEKSLQEKVRQQIEKTQKEYYLHEKLKAIKKELGEKGEYLDEIEELKEKIKKAKLPKEANEKCLKEISRLEKMPPMAAEASVIRTYIDWILDLPWSKKTNDKKDIKKAAEILDEDHYGLKKVKERILEYLAVRQLVKKIKGQILCFVGPPGVGKTSLARSIARSLGRNFVRISLGGVRDEAEIRGHRRTYVGALPGRIIQGMKKAKSKNPVFLLDEVDKMSTDFRGDPSAALLEVLDPEQNHAFSDHYIEIPFDLSDVFFITTANTTMTIPKPLLDRMEVIHIPGYTEIEKYHIAEQFLIPKQLKEHGLDKPSYTIKFSKSAIMEIIRYYTREAGVRELERNIASICRKIAKKIVEENKKGKITIHITPHKVAEYLGPRKYRYSEAEERDEIGVATGLAWTEAGGDIISIEVSVVPGTGKLLLTGKLGEVMQESAQTALSYARSKTKEYKLSPLDFYKKMDIHIHVPEGAVPKDGPSAGITIATALISALSKIPVRKDVAMTGEITLRGKVLPIGGLKEKLLAAHRANIKHVILPLENKKDFEEIPKDVKKSITFHFVKDMSQVLKVALTDASHINADEGEVFKPVEGKQMKKKRKKNKSREVSSTQENEIQPVL